MAPTSEGGIMDAELLAAASALLGLVQAAALARRGVTAEPATLAEIERRHILHVLDEVRGNRKRCAAILGIDRKTLHRKLACYRSGEHE